VSANSLQRPFSELQYLRINFILRLAIISFVSVIPKKQRHSLITSRETVRKSLFHHGTRLLVYSQMSVKGVLLRGARQRIAVELIAEINFVVVVEGAFVRLSRRRNHRHGRRVVGRRSAVALHHVAAGGRCRWRQRRTSAARDDRDRPSQNFDDDRFCGRADRSHRLVCRRLIDVMSIHLNIYIHFECRLREPAPYTNSDKIIMPPARREGDNKRCFCPSVRLSFAYIANN